MLRLVESDEEPPRAITGEEVMREIAELVASLLPGVPVDDPYVATLRSFARPAMRRPTKHGPR